MQAFLKKKKFVLNVGTGTGQPVNGAIPSLPSPTMPNFNMAAQTPNGQPAGSDPGVYTNGIPQTFAGREYQLGRIVPPLRAIEPIRNHLLLQKKKIIQSIYIYFLSAVLSQNCKKSQKPRHAYLR